MKLSSITKILAISVALFSSIASVVGRPPEIFHTDLYWRLGLYPSATYTEIALAFQKEFGQQHHAVEASGAKPEGMKSVFEAGSTLLDPESKEEWDTENLLPEDRAKVPVNDQPHPRWREIVTEARLKMNLAIQSPSAPIEIIELEPTPTAPVIPKTPIGAVSLGSLSDEPRAGKLRRADVLRWSTRYQAFRSTVHERTFRKEFKSNSKKSDAVTAVDATPRVAEDLIQAQLNRATAWTWPGWAFATLGATTYFTVWQSVIPLVGAGLLAAGDVFKFRTSRAYAAAFERFDRFVKHELATNPFDEEDKPFRSRLAGGLLEFDLWYELYSAAVQPPKSDYGSSDLHPMKEYAMSYQSYRPIQILMIERGRRDPIFAEALLFRMFQNRVPAEQLLELMRPHADYWLGVAANLKHAFDESSTKDLSDAQIGYEATRVFLKTNARSGISSLKFNCVNSLRGTWYAFRSILRR